MFIKHPKESGLINTELFTYIHACNVNPTHVDFYREPPPPGERGTPALVVVLATTVQRDTWFAWLEETLGVDEFDGIEDYK